MPSFSGYLSNMRSNYTIILCLVAHKRPSHYYILLLPDVIVYDTSELFSDEHHHLCGVLAYYEAASRI